MKENKLVDLSRQFAVDIINLCTRIKESGKGNVLLNQILRSGTSIGANIHEANYAASKADFINKLQIALKECYESEYWLGLFKETKMITEQEYTDIFNKCSKIRRLLVASVTTAKNGAIGSSAHELSDGMNGKHSFHELNLIGSGKVGQHEKSLAAHGGKKALLSSGTNKKKA